MKQDKQVYSGWISPTVIVDRSSLLEAIVVHVTSSVIAAVYKKAGRRNWAPLAS